METELAIKGLALSLVFMGIFLIHNSIASAYVDTSYSSYNLAFAIDNGGNATSTNIFSIENNQMEEYPHKIRGLRLDNLFDVSMIIGGGGGGAGGVGWYRANLTGENITGVITTIVKKPQNYYYPLLFLIILVLVIRAVKLQKKRKEEKKD